MNLIKFKNKVSDEMIDFYAAKQDAKHIQARGYYFQPEVGVKHIEIPGHIMKNPIMLESALRMFCKIGKVRHFALMCEAQAASVKVSIDRDAISNLLGDSPEDLKRNLAKMIKKQADGGELKRILVMQFTSVETTEQINVVMNVDENGQLDFTGDQTTEISSKDDTQGVLGQFPTILEPGLF